MQNRNFSISLPFNVPDNADYLNNPHSIFGVRKLELLDYVS